MASLADLSPEGARKVLTGWERHGIAHVSIFGSAARGSGGVDSDIDVLIIRPDSVDDDDDTWTGQMDALAGTAYEWTGNRLEWLERSESAFGRAGQVGESIVAELESDSIVLLVLTSTTSFGRAEGDRNPSVQRRRGGDAR